MTAMPLCGNYLQLYRCFKEFGGRTTSQSAGSPKYQERKEAQRAEFGVVRKDVLDNKGVKSVKIVAIDFVRWIEITH